MRRGVAVGAPRLASPRATNNGRRFKAPGAREGGGVARTSNSNAGSLGKRGRWRAAEVVEDEKGGSESSYGNASEGICI